MSFAAPLTRRQFSALLAAQTRVSRPPNIVLILADDLGYEGIGCFGSKGARTPNLDALASGGVRLTDFHSNGAVCSPTRAALLTGRYQQRCGIPDVLGAASHRDQGLPLSEVVFPALLQRAGYATGIVGKWHLGYHPTFNPVRYGFDFFRGYVSGNVDYFSHVDQTGRPDWWHDTRQTTEAGYTTELFARHAVEFIEANRRRPFLLYLPHEAPHGPYQGPKDRALRVAGGDGRAPSQRKDVERAHDEMVEAMDRAVGEVMTALERNGLERDTLVFFFSDNGGVPAVRSNGKLAGHKSTLWEGGHRVPAIARWPGQIPAGRECHETALGFDLFPTFLEAAGVAPPARPLDGQSLVATLRHGKPLPARTLFWGHGKQRAVRRGRWKMLLEDQADPSAARLYDLRADVGETNDLAVQEPRTRMDLLQALKRWEKDVAGGMPGRVGERQENAQ